ncbi:hypothetical protein VA7868_02846 [Vibrio aerogenes CECT 7868]|uniref:Double Cache domain-containing protein n=1 Tax=Vibrio aerogenes CECT 7868 TaxID=1216006 RepID=A0A1M5ZK92_9VIBR|nr:cache domain-containing protein [Vibrio aerogenes]SHI24707.1 hypothetical protein VA7868_02846 [Vibrio aerogenes CECT 7868]
MSIHKSHQFLFLWFIFQLVFVVALYYFTEEQVHKIYIESKKGEIGNILDMVHHHAELIIHQSDQGSPEARKIAEQKIINYLEGFHSGDLYFWANDHNAIARVHPRDSVVGQFQNSYLRHLNQLESHDLFFETRLNLNPVTDELQVKINGIMLLKPWKWVVGYGSYIDRYQIMEKTMYLMIIPVAGLLLCNGFIVLYVRRMTNSKMS